MRNISRNITIKNVIIILLIITIVIVGTSCTKKESISDSSVLITEKNISNNSVTEPEINDATTNIVEKSTIGNDNSEETDITYHSKIKDDIDPNYLDEISVVVGSKYISITDQNEYLIFNEDGIVVLSSRSLDNGYNIWESNYIVKDNEVWIYFPSGASYIGYVIKDNTLNAGDGYIYIKE